MVTHLKKYVLIQEDCSMKCTFCPRPFDKNNERFYPINEILIETSDAFEVQLTGPNICAYNDNGTNLIDLCKEILKNNEKINVIELNNVLPAMPITYDLLDYISKEKRMAKYVNLSVQSGSNSVLKRMGLLHTKEDIDKILKFNLDFGIHIITGFPGETEKEYKETINSFKRWKKINKHLFVNIFPYFNKLDSVAYNFPNQLDETLINKRADKLNIRLHNSNFQLRAGRFYPQMNFINIMRESKNNVMLNNIQLKSMLSDSFDLSIFKNYSTMQKPEEFIDLKLFIMVCKKLYKFDKQILRNLIYNASSSTYVFKEHPDLTFETVVSSIYHNEEKF